ncbi:MAG: carboxymuconolactone decarboxylase family protein [Ectothiorhodospiraceae bacterium]|nr:carboxymuconolactone decarboxylase family protein [Ectothiorhodospiraceae bacterium]
MDEKLAKKGIEMRKAVLGAEYVERSMQSADDFNQDFQGLLNEYCWGFCWGDDTLSRRERSILNLGMIAALGRTHEFELHFRGAINNGLTREELKQVLHQIAVYCGMPAGVESFRIARKVLAELDAKKEG